MENINLIDTTDKNEIALIEKIKQLLDYISEGKNAKTVNIIYCQAVDPKGEKHENIFTFIFTTTSGSDFIHMLIPELNGLLIGNSLAMNKEKRNNLIFVEKERDQFSRKLYEHLKVIKEASTQVELDKMFLVKEGINVNAAEKLDGKPDLENASVIKTLTFYSVILKKQNGEQNAFTWGLPKSEEIKQIIELYSSQSKSNYVM
jgi:hypothetical protein